MNNAERLTKQVEYLVEQEIPFRVGRGGSPTDTTCDCAGLVIRAGREIGLWGEINVGVAARRGGDAGRAGKAEVMRFVNLIDRSEMQRGDVLTFDCGKGEAHVALYIGNGWFAHTHEGKGHTVNGYLPNSKWYRALHSVYRLKNWEDEYAA